MRTQYLQALPDHWQPSAAVFAALGDTTRQKILLLFEPGEELSIKDIAARFELGRTTIVHHLASLEKAGILLPRRQGRLALYRLNYDVVLEALDNLRQLIDEDRALLPVQTGHAGQRGQAERACQAKRTGLTGRTGRNSAENESDPE